MYFPEAINNAKEKQTQTFKYLITNENIPVKTIALKKYFTVKTTTPDKRIP